MVPSGRSSKPARWLALGDSYTIGEGVAAEDRWPHRVFEALRAAGVKVEPPRILATTGWTTAELMAAMEHERLWPARERFELVSLMIGVNDQYRGRDAGEFAPLFAQCLERAVALAGGDAGRVVVASVPDWGVTPFAGGRDRGAIARAVDEYNKAEQDVVRKRGARWCDVTTLSRRHGSDTAYLAGDGLHPGAAAYRAWAGVLALAAREALAGRGEAAQTKRA